MRASKKSLANKLLEWVFYGKDTIIAWDSGSAADQSDRIELGLRDDEVADIWSIDSYWEADQISAANPAFNAMISMDPDKQKDPGVLENHEDLEVFFEHFVGWDFLTSGLGKKSDKKTMYYNPPITVGTDLGICLDGDDTDNGTYGVRIMYTRRKAKGDDLYDILLKRK